MAPDSAFVAELPDSARWFDLSGGHWMSDAPKSRVDLEAENALLRELLKAAAVTARV